MNSSWIIDKNDWNKRKKDIVIRLSYRCGRGYTHIQYVYKYNTHTAISQIIIITDWKYFCLPNNHFPNTHSSTWLNNNTFQIMSWSKTINHHEIDMINSKKTIEHV